MRKAVRRVELKDADEGKVRAVVATLGVKDKDGDVIEPGAFGTQEVRVSAFNHESWNGALPVGKGTVTERGNQAVADLQFFMDTDPGRNTFRTVKNLGELGEWSFGFDVTEEGAPDEEQEQNGVRRVLKGLAVYEVSPVLRGAGVGTRTVAAKCIECGDPLGPTVTTPTPADVRAARRAVRRAGEALAEPPGTVLKHPDDEVQELAEFAVRIGHRLAGSMDALADRIGSPDVKWSSFDGRTDGIMRKGEWGVTLALDLRGSALVKAALHEVRHHAQADPTAPGMEADADAFASRWAKAVERAYRLSRGRPWRVTIKGGWPPWSGHRRGDVVLSRSAVRAYHFNPRNAGGSWT